MIKILFFLTIIKCFISSPIYLNTSIQATSNIKDIFLGRCFYFFNIIHKNNHKIQSVNCSEIWNEFTNIVLNKKPCDILIEDYNRFLNLTDHYFETDKSVLWSGTGEWAHEISKINNYWTLEDTLPGFLLDGLTICSDVSNQDFLVSCQSECVSKNNPYWNAASRNYASKASGEVVVILNGTRTIGALSNRSTFFQHELPYFNFGQVLKLKVFLLHYFNKPKYETCSNPKTLTILKNYVISKNASFECIDDYKRIFNFLCNANSNSFECQGLLSIIGNNSSTILSNSFKVKVFILVYLFYLSIKFVY